jgi:hypothetical protein
MGRAGDGSTLNLDFTAMGGVLDPRITFSRADATARATFINSLGYVETVPAGQPQAPRFTFSETSIGTPRGLLLEAPTTNHQLSSEAFATNLGYTDGDIISPRTTGTSPSNGTAVGFYPTVAAGYHRLQYSAGVTLSGAVTVSMWFKRLNSNYRAGINATSFMSASVIVDLNGSGSIITLGGSAANRAATITRYQNDWYRVALTGTFVAGTSMYFFMDSSISTDSGGGSFTGVASQGMLMWGGQIELGSQASSYIATTNIAVTRAVDTAIIAAGSNFSSWYTGGTTGTFVTEWCRCSPTTTQRTVIATSDVSNQHLHQYIAATTSRLRLADKVPAFIETANASVDNSINKGAFSYSGSVQSLCLNGGTVVPGTLTFTIAPTWLSIGGPSTNGTSITDTAVVLNNAIRKIKYFPTRLSDGQIQGLTT